MVLRTLLSLAFGLCLVHADFSNPVRGWEPGPFIMGRASWGAKPTLPGGVRQTISRITVHHAGVPTNRKRTFVDKLRGLQTFSQRVDKLASGKEKPAWIDIPYHYYIDWRGQIAACRPVEWSGDTNTEYNPKGHLLICLEGEFDTEEPTAAQIRALTDLLRDQREWYGIGPSRVQTHKDFAVTGCPGKNLYRQMPELIRASTP